MKKKLYYTIEKYDESKQVIVYDIINNEPKEFCSLDLLIEDNTKEEILNYLNDNGHGDEEFDLIQL